MTSTKVTDLEYRSVCGWNIWIAKYEDVCRLEILMPSGIVRERIGRLIGYLHYVPAVVQVLQTSD
jgi:hypothetical protein